MPFNIYRLLKRNSTKNTDNLENIIQCFDSVCSIISKLNEVFSVPFLFYLSGKFVLVIATTFVFIFSIINSRLEIDGLRQSCIFIAISEWIKILIILSSPEMPLLQVGQAEFL